MSPAAGRLYFALKAYLSDLYSINPYVELMSKSPRMLSSTYPTTMVIAALVQLRIWEVFELAFKTLEGPRVSFALSIFSPIFFISPQKVIDPRVFPTHTTRVSPSTTQAGSTQDISAISALLPCLGLLLGIIVLKTRRAPTCSSNSVHAGLGRPPGPPFFAQSLNSNSPIRNSAPHLNPTLCGPDDDEEKELDETFVGGDDSFGGDGSGEDGGEEEEEEERYEEEQSPPPPPPPPPSSCGSGDPSSQGSLWWWFLVILAVLSLWLLSRLLVSRIRRLRKSTLAYPFAKRMEMGVAEEFLIGVVGSFALIRLGTWTGERESGRTPRGEATQLSRSQEIDHVDPSMVNRTLVEAAPVPRLAKLSFFEVEVPTGSLKAAEAATSPCQATETGKSDSTTHEHVGTQTTTQDSKIAQESRITQVPASTQTSDVNQVSISTQTSFVVQVSASAQTAVDQVSTFTQTSHSGRCTSSTQTLEMFPMKRNVSIGIQANAVPAQHTYIQTGAQSEVPIFTNASVQTSAPISISNDPVLPTSVHTECFENVTAETSVDTTSTSSTTLEHLSAKVFSPEKFTYAEIEGEIDRDFAELREERRGVPEQDDPDDLQPDQHAPLERRIPEQDDPDSLQPDQHAPLEQLVQELAKIDDKPQNFDQDVGHLNANLQVLEETAETVLLMEVSNTQCFKALPEADSPVIALIVALQDGATEDGAGEELELPEEGSYVVFRMGGAEKVLDVSLSYEEALWGAASRCMADGGIVIANEATYEAVEKMAEQLETLEVSRVGLEEGAVEDEPETPIFDGEALSENDGVNKVGQDESGTQNPSVDKNQKSSHIASTFELEPQDHSTSIQRQEYWETEHEDIDALQSRLKEELLEELDHLRRELLANCHGDETRILDVLEGYLDVEEMLDEAAMPKAPIPMSDFGSCKKPAWPPGAVRIPVPEVNPAWLEWLKTKPYNEDNIPFPTRYIHPDFFDQCRRYGIPFNPRRLQQPPAEPEDLTYVTVNGPIWRGFFPNGPFLDDKDVPLCLKFCHPAFQDRWTENNAHLQRLAILDQSQTDLASSAEIEEGNGECTMHQLSMCNKPVTRNDEAQEKLEPALKLGNVSELAPGVTTVRGVSRSTCKEATMGIGDRDNEDSVRVQDEASTKAEASMAPEEPAICEGQNAEDLNLGEETGDQQGAMEEVQDVLPVGSNELLVNIDKTIDTDVTQYQVVPLPHLRPVVLEERPQTEPSLADVLRNIQLKRVHSKDEPGKRSAASMLSGLGRHYRAAGEDYVAPSASKSQQASAPSSPALSAVFQINHPVYTSMSSPAPRCSYSSTFASPSASNPTEPQRHILTGRALNPVCTNIIHPTPPAPLIKSKPLPSKVVISKHSSVPNFPNFWGNLKK